MIECCVDSYPGSARHGDPHSVRGRLRENGWPHHRFFEGADRHRNAFLEVDCGDVLMLGEVVDAKLSAEGLWLIAADVLHLLAVDSVAEHARFWS
jgi:hypothetical protein